MTTETKTEAPAAERVAAGFAFLEVRDPGFWRTGIEREIDLDELDLESPRLCVLGQRCPLETFNATDLLTPYEAFGARLSGLPVARLGDLDAWAVPLGFQAVDDPDDEDATELDFYLLTAEWRRVIKSRRDEADDRAEAAS